MDWRKGYSSRYYVAVVDPDSWGDTERFEITGGSIKHELTSLRTSADLDCVNYFYNREQIIRVWLDTHQNGGGEHVPLFTGYTSSPNRNIDGRRESQTMQCYSVLLPAADILLDRGWYAPVYADGLSLVKSLLKCTNSPVEISEKTNQNTSLSQAIIAESGETKLSMAEKILQAINWRMNVDGYGKIMIKPYETEPVLTLDSRQNDIMEPSISIEYDWFNCPNVFRAIMDNDVAIARDETSDTPVSIIGRGREVWYEESDCVLNDGETLKEYANRRLKELQRVSQSISYDRRFWPEVYPTDVIRINYPYQKLSGDFYISSQTVNLGYSPKVSEEVIQL